MEENKDFPIVEWQREVANNETDLTYEQWVELGEEIKNGKTGFNLDGVDK